MAGTFKLTHCPFMQRAEIRERATAFRQPPRFGQTLVKIKKIYGQTRLAESVPLHDPVKFEPPPPRAPPTTEDLKFSGVPAWSELLNVQVFVCAAFTPSEL